MGRRSSTFSSSPLSTKFITAMKNGISIQILALCLRSGTGWQGLFMCRVDGRNSPWAFRTANMKNITRLPGFTFCRFEKHTMYFEQACFPLAADLARMTTTICPKTNCPRHSHIIETIRFKAISRVWPFSAPDGNAMFRAPFQYRRQVAILGRRPSPGSRNFIS